MYSIFIVRSSPFPVIFCLFSFDLAKIYDGEPMNQGMKKIAGCKIIHHLQCGEKKRMIYKFQSHMR